MTIYCSGGRRPVAVFCQLMKGTGPYGMVPCSDGRQPLALRRRPDLTGGLVSVPSHLVVCLAGPPQAAPPGVVSRLTTVLRLSSPIPQNSLRIPSRSTSREASHDGAPHLFPEEVTASRGPPTETASDNPSQRVHARRSGRRECGRVKQPYGWLRETGRVRVACSSHC